MLAYVKKVIYACRNVNLNANLRYFFWETNHMQSRTIIWKNMDPTTEKNGENWAHSIKYFLWL